jgi:hypothetical protein
MATAQEKQDLVELLKAKTARYEISLWGYGGEIVVGTITPDQYLYWRDRDDLAEHCTDYDNDNPATPVDDSLCLVSNANWHELDDVAHDYGCEFGSACGITVTNTETGETVFDCRLDCADLEAAGVETHGFAYTKMHADQHHRSDHVFVGQSIEKGVFYTGDVETIGRFDPRKLSMHLTEVQGWHLVSGVSYASQIVDDTGGIDTRGKGMNFEVLEIARGAAV